MKHPYDSWDIEKIVLAYEDSKMKDNCERDEFTPSLFVGEKKIGAK